jgi:hypothetical protein
MLLKTVHIGLLILRAGCHKPKSDELLFGFQKALTLKTVLHHFDWSQRNSHCIARKDKSLNDMRAVLHHVWPDVVQQMHQRILTTKSINSQSQMSNGINRNLSVNNVAENVQINAKY